MNTGLFGGTVKTVMHLKTRVLSLSLRPCIQSLAIGLLLTSFWGVGVLAEFVRSIFFNLRSDDSSYKIDRGMVLLSESARLIDCFKSS